jgi:hypothetical protein
VWCGDAALSLSSPALLSEDEEEEEASDEEEGIELKSETSPPRSFEACGENKARQLGGLCS